MNILIDDVILHIITFLNNKEKILFLSQSKYLDSLKDKTYYDDDIIINEINHLWYFDRFTHVICYNINLELPKFVTHIEFNENDNIKDCIPNTVTHLILADSFDGDISGCIPNSITHLHLVMYLIKISKIVYLIQ